MTGELSNMAGFVLGVALATMVMNLRDAYRRKIRSWRHLLENGVYIDHYFDDRFTLRYFDPTANAEKEVVNPFEVMFVKFDIFMTVMFGKAKQRVLYYDWYGEELHITPEVEQDLLRYKERLEQVRKETGGMSWRRSNELKQAAPYRFCRKIYFRPRAVPKQT